MRKVYINRTFLARLFLQALLIFILIGCSSTHRLSDSHKQTDTNIDKTQEKTSSIHNVIITEKADTTITYQKDSAEINFFAPINVTDSTGDTTSIFQEVESDNIKIQIHATPVYRNGKIEGTQFTAKAIKKVEELHVVVNKTTVENSSVVQDKKNNIVQSATVVDKSKDVTKKKFNFFGLVIVLFIILLLFYLLRDRLKTLI